jgi:ATP-binding cassette, subfamily B, vacuolar membrane transporter HMT1/ACLQ
MTSFFKAPLWFVFVIAFVVLAKLVFLLIGRLLNVLIPRQLGMLTDNLTGENGEPRIISFHKNILTKAKMPWVSLLVYVSFTFIQGNLIMSAQSYFWIPVEQVFPISI